MTSFDTNDYRQPAAERASISATEDGPRPAGFLLEQLIQDVLHRLLHAGEDRRVSDGVLAALGLAQLHHEVEEVLGLFGLEGDDEVLVVQAEAVGRVELYAGV